VIATPRAQKERLIRRRADPYIRVPLAILAAIGLIFLLRSERAVLIPIVLSVLISYALEPIVRWLVLRRLPRLAAAILVMTAMLATIAILAYTLGDDALRLIERMPESVRQIREQLVESSSGEGGLTDRLQRAIAAIREAAQAAREGGPTTRPAAPAAGESLFRTTTRMLTAASDAIVVLFLVFFLLLSGDLFRRKLLSIAGPQLSRRRAMLHLLRDIEMRMQRFFVVRVVTGIIVGIATWAGLQWLGFEHAPVWGLLAGVCNAIPYLGPLIVSAGLAVVALVQFGTVSMALYAAGLALVITSLEGWLLDPFLMGKAERMNAVAVLVGLVFWTSVWGAWGAFLAVPLLAIIKAISDHNRTLRPFGRLLGE